MTANLIFNKLANDCELLSCTRTLPKKFMFPLSVSLSDRIKLICPME